MATRGIFVKQSGTWKEVKQSYVKLGGVWQPIEKGYVKRNGQWSQYYPDQGQEIFATVGPTGWLVPAGVNSVVVTVVAGGGGGGGSGTQYGPGGGGGGGGAGGAVFEAVMTVSPDEVLAITVGDGGKGAPEVSRTTAAVNGENGGTSSVIGNLGSIVAIGGTGGSGPALSAILGSSTSVQNIVYSLAGGAGGAGGNVSLNGNAQVGTDTPLVFSGQAGTGTATDQITSVGGAPGSRILSGSPLPYGNGGLGANSTSLTAATRPAAQNGNPGLVIINW